MSYCKNCQKLIKKKHETAYGVWEFECQKLGIGRNEWSSACNKIDLIPEKVEDFG